jgi:Zn-dependent protease
MLPSLVAVKSDMLRPAMYNPRPAVPILISRGALALIVMLAAVFTIFGAVAGLPLQTAAIVGSLGGAVSLLFHEWGHIRAASSVAGLRPRSVSLQWAGAATTFEGRYQNGRDQIRVAVGGPQASFILALALFAVCVLPAPMSTKEPLVLLAVFNIALGLLNLVPAYPLDGYKLVTGFLWSLTGSEAKALRIVRRIGIGWAALEAPAALLLLLEKPALGGLVLMVGAVLLVQKRLMPVRAH